eukprot:scaffold1736_cov127-Cylindrotheca_fusiformis.AAC.82
MPIVVDDYNFGYRLLSKPEPAKSCYFFPQLSLLLLEPQYFTYWVSRSVTNRSFNAGKDRARNKAVP